jgi:hypothetical protein
MSTVQETIPAAVTDRRSHVRIFVPSVQKVWQARVADPCHVPGPYHYQYRQELLRKRRTYLGIGLNQVRVRNFSPQGRAGAISHVVVVGAEPAG